MCQTKNKNNEELWKRITQIWRQRPNRKSSDSKTEKKNKWIIILTEIEEQLK